MRAEGQFPAMARWEKNARAKRGEATTQAGIEKRGVDQDSNHDDEKRTNKEKDAVTLKRPGKA